MSPTVRVHAHARPLRRGPGEVQFGAGQGDGIVLAGLSPQEVELLCELGDPRSSGAVESAAQRSGVSPSRLGELLTALDRHGVLVHGGSAPDSTLADMPALRSPLAPPASAADAVPWAARAAALARAYRLEDDGTDLLAARGLRRVQVVGRGRLADLLADHLRRSGVGQVEVSTELDPAVAPHLGVLLAHGALAPQVARQWQSSGVAHLPLIVREHSVSLGPLVVPGHGPCLGCLDLHRRDRDQAWPGLAAQLVDDLSGSRTDPVLAAAGAGLAAMVAQAHLDGAQQPGGICWEVRLPWPEVLTRVWTRHPRCRCHAAGIRT